jgi:chemotaxis protein CheY-P-specific phosphatase CheC
MKNKKLRINRAMENLNTIELFAAKSIINKGLAKAAESLSFFMKEEILFNESSFNINKLDKNTDFTSKLGKNIHLLITNVIGELKGVCCLIFSEAEADKLRHSALPKEITENPELMAEMSDAIMLEVDNIISASVITQFSNLLNNRIYGSVPELKKLSIEELSTYVESNFARELYIINFKTRFSSVKLDFNPEFVWLFDKTFMESIRSFANKSMNLSRLNEPVPACIPTTV